MEGMSEESHGSSGWVCGWVYRLQSRLLASRPHRARPGSVRPDPARPVRAAQSGSGSGAGERREKGWKGEGAREKVREKEMAREGEKE